MAEMENASTLNLSEQEQIRRQKLASAGGSRAEPLCGHPL